MTYSDTPPSTRAVPNVDCPTKGRSLVGEKMRTRSYRGAVSETPSPGDRMHLRRTACLRSGVVVLASLALGFLTFFAQGALPEWFASFANSASGWTILTVLLVLWSRQPWPIAAPLGAASFVLLTVGYSVASSVQGLYYNPTMFALVGAVAGPFVGVAASWLSARGVRAALATSALAGVGLGEALYGLTVVGDTTSPVYWITIGVMALGLLAWMLAKRIRGALPIAVAVMGTAGVAAAFVAVYSLPG